MTHSAKNLGEDSADIELDSWEANYATTLELVSQASRTIDIFSQSLTESIYNHHELIDQLKRCLLISQSNHLRILITNPEYLVKGRHQISALAERLTDKLEIRKIHPDYAADPQDFLIVDGRGTICRKHGDRYEGIANFNDPRLGKELTDYFDEVWNHSTQPADLRRLNI